MRLNLSNQWLGPQVLLDRLSGEPLDQIEELELGYNQLGAEGAAGLARLSMPALRILKLEANRLGQAGAEALAGAAWIEQLTGLYLGGAPRYGRDNGLGERGVAVLVPRLKAVRALDLSFNLLSGQALRLLEPLTLETLSLASNRLDDAGVQALFAVPRPSLTQLSLSSCGLTAGAARVIAASDAQLEALDFSNAVDSAGLDNRPGDEGVVALAGSRVLARVRRLGLKRCGIGDEGAEALARSPWLEHLEHLWLNENEITERGLEALVKSDRLPRLRSIGLSNNPAGPREEVFTDWDGGVAGGSFDDAAADAIAKRFGRDVQVS